MFQSLSSKWERRILLFLLHSINYHVYCHLYAFVFYSVSTQLQKTLIDGNRPKVHVTALPPTECDAGGVVANGDGAG